MKHLLRGGTIYDGGGLAPYRGDLLLRDGRIAAIGPDLPADDAEVFDAAGLAVTPGFVDIHRHCDVAAVCDPDFGKIELAQGITSAVCGNCGLAPVPVSPPYRDAAYAYIEPVVGPAEPPWRASTHAEWLAQLRERGLPLHLGFLVGAGAVKAAVRGYAGGAMTPAELDAAKALVAEGMEAGALGLSVGLMYQPECWSTEAELVALAGVAARYGGRMTAHIRGEGDSLVASVDEVIRVAAAAGLPLQISHFKATGIRNWNRLLHTAIAHIEAARAAGQDVTVDFYPYAGGSTTLQSLLPPTVLEDDLPAMLRRMGTREGRLRLRRELQTPHPGWDNMAESIGWDRILVSAVTRPENARLQGKSLLALARELGLEEPADLVTELLCSEAGRVGIIVLSMSQQDVDTVARLPYSLLISDALYARTDHPHPRLYGAFPHFLHEYAVERGVLPLETAIRKMTSMPAERMGLRDRGVLRAGAHADVLAFDPATFRSEADYQHPTRLAQGLRAAWLGGEPVWTGGRPVRLQSGRLLARF